MNNTFSPSERDELLQRVSVAEAKAQECQIEAAVYRDQLTECEDLAMRAFKTKNPQLLLGSLSKASLTLKNRNVKEWGKTWKDCWEMDIKWLKRALKSLKEIKDAANQLSVDQYIIQLAETVHNMFERGVTDPSAQEIAEAHFPGKALPGDIIESVRKQLHRVRTVLLEDYDQPVYLLSRTYYNRFRSKATTVFAAKRLRTSQTLGDVFRWDTANRLRAFGCTPTAMTI
jgi:hypothetical protein